MTELEAFTFVAVVLIHPVWNIARGYTVNLGVQEEDEFSDFNEDIKPWQTAFTIADIIIHKKYGMSRKDGSVTYYRKDYDIALIRLDYPVADERTGMCIIWKLFDQIDKERYILQGMGVLEGAIFNSKTIRPICLPPSTTFNDTGRIAVAVGLGISASQWV